MIAIDPVGMFWFLLWVALAIYGVVAIVIAIVSERRMQRHRQPGVSYSDVTFRRDGGWRNTDLFTDEGLKFQSRAAKWGMIGVSSIILAMIIRMFANG